MIKIDKNIYGEDDDIAAPKMECNYCNHVWGYSELYQIGGYLRRYQGTTHCGNLKHGQVYYSAHERLIHPYNLSREEYSSFHN